MWTLPNILTMMRIFVIPILMASFYLEDLVLGSWIAVVTFGLAGITDFFDGYLARAAGSVSKIGQFLDPIADKLMVGAVIIMLTSFQWVEGIHVVAATIILLRELMVSGLREFLAGVQVSVPVSMAAKWKTTIQMLALGALCGTYSLPELGIPSYEIGIWGLWIAAVLTLYTGLDYLRAGLKHMV